MDTRDRWIRACRRAERRLIAFRAAKASGDTKEIDRRADALLRACRVASKIGDIYMPLTGRAS